MFVLKSETNRDKSTEIFPPLLLYMCIVHVHCAMTRSKKGQQKVQTLKKMPVHCWSVFFISLWKSSTGWCRVNHQVAGRLHESKFWGWGRRRKGVCHEIFDPNFSDSSGHLKNRLNYFRIRFRFRRDIQSQNPTTILLRTEGRLWGWNSACHWYWCNLAQLVWSAGIEEGWKQKARQRSSRRF